MSALQSYERAMPVAVPRPQSRSSGFMNGRLECSSVSHVRSTSHAARTSPVPMSKAFALISQISSAPHHSLSSPEIFGNSFFFSHRLPNPCLIFVTLHHHNLCLSIRLFTELPSQNCLSLELLEMIFTRPMTSFCFTGNNTSVGAWSAAAADSHALSLVHIASINTFRIC